VLARAADNYEIWLVSAALVLHHMKKYAAPSVPTRFPEN
jgi:hypothetical protein